MEYENLLACYESGQISEKQWQSHIDADPAFAAWLKERG